MARSTYYYKPVEKTQAQKRSLVELRDSIEKITLDWPHYGYRRVRAELERQGISVNHKKVARIMREESLQCQVIRKYLRPKNKKTGLVRFNVAANLTKGLRLKRSNQLWVADITYIRLDQQFVFLAVILDAWSRRVIGWAISESMQVELTIAALRMAILMRRPKPNTCIHHSDRGSQYASNDYTEMLKDAGLKASMSKPGYPYDNAIAESFMKTLKKEEVDCTEYKDLDDLKGRIPYFITKIYNERRLHSALGYLPPAEYETTKPKRYNVATSIRIN
jgi:putative transposase